MTANNPSPDWNTCPQGEIAGLVDSLKKQRRRKSFQQAAGVTSAIVLLVFVGTSVISGFFRGQTPIQSIACNKVHELAPQYVARQLDADLTGQIYQHLIRCKRCRDHIHEEYPQFAIPVGAANPWHAATLPIATAQFGRFASVSAYQSER